MRTINETEYRTTDVRAFVIAACAHLYHTIVPDALLCIRYARKGQRVQGRATVGRRRNAIMTLFLPHDMEAGTIDMVWQTALHEVGHWIGWRHVDYPSDLRWCVPSPHHPRPASLVLRLKPARQPADRDTIKMERAAERIAVLSRRMKGLQTRIKKWKRRLADAERRVQKAAGSLKAPTPQVEE